MDSDPRLQPHALRALAVAAECAPSTVRRFWLGLPIRWLSRRRIERAIAAGRRENQLEELARGQESEQ